MMTAQENHMPATTGTPVVAHHIRWFGVTQDANDRRIRVPRTRYMPDSGWGWDATCSCGWDSREGGAIAACIRRRVRDHKWDVANGFWSPDDNRR